MYLVLKCQFLFLDIETFLLCLLDIFSVPFDFIMFSPTLCIPSLHLLIVSHMIWKFQPWLIFLFLLSECNMVLTLLSVFRISSIPWYSRLAMLSAVFLDLKSFSFFSLSFTLYEISISDCFMHVTDFLLWVLHVFPNSFIGFSSFSLKN